MAKQSINIGTVANDPVADTIRSAFDKVNDNFDEIYNSVTHAIYAANFGVSASSTATQNREGIQEALDTAFSNGVKTVILPPGTLLLNENGSTGYAIRVPSGMRLMGCGMYVTSLETDPSEKFGYAIIDADQEDNIELCDFGATFNAEEEDYDEYLGALIDLSAGSGGSTSTRWVTFRNLYLHNAPRQAVQEFKGSIGLHVEGCRIENIGRGSLISNGMREARIIGNYFGACGDDGLAIQNTTHGALVVGNIFNRCGTLGEQVGPAAVNCSGGFSNTIVGNTFRDCNIAIRMFANTQVTNPRTHYNRGGHNIIDGNAIYGGTSSSYATYGLIQLNETYNVVVSNNIVFGVAEDGTLRRPIGFGAASNIKSYGNIYVGSSVWYGNYKHNDIEFRNDTFYVMPSDDGDWDDSSSNGLSWHASGTTCNNLRYVDCKLSENAATYFRVFGNSTVDIALDGIELIPAYQIAWPDADGSPITGTITSIPLRSREHQDGLLLNLKSGMRLLIVNTSGEQEELIVDGDHDIGDTTLNVESVTLSNTYVHDQCWIAFDKPDATAGQRAGMGTIGPGANVTVKFANLDDIRSVKITGPGDSTLETRVSGRFGRSVWVPIDEARDSGSPVGSVTPKIIGQEYFDTSNNNWYKSVGTTDQDWVQIN